jgi:hypothetical protein
LSEANCGTLRVASTKGRTEKPFLLCIISEPQEIKSNNIILSNKPHKLLQLSLQRPLSTCNRYG